MNTNFKSNQSTLFTKYNVEHIEKFSTFFFSLIQDSSLQNNKLWNQLYAEYFQHNRKDLEGNLTYYSQKKQSLITYNFALAYQCLYRFKKNKIHFFSISNLYLVQINPTIQGIQYFGFAFICGQKNIEFLLTDEKQRNFWFITFQKYCIQLNFHNNFKLIQQLGKGNYARVCEGKKGNQHFAIKIYEKEKLNTLTEKVQQVQKDFFVKRDVYEDDKYIYMVLDLLKGGELLSKLKIQQNHDERYVCEIIRRLLISLDYLHGLNIIHRDLKPENILLRFKDDPYDICISDFGLADFYSPIGNYLFKRCGTPGYVAPEILNDQIYDHKVDVFSIGVLMFIMLIGSLPFKGDNYDEIVINNYHCNINLDQYAPRLSIHALEVLQKVLNKDSSQRPTPKQILEFEWFSNTQRGFSDLKINEFPRFDPSDNPELYSKSVLVRAPVDTLTENSQSSKATSHKMQEEIGINKVNIGQIVKVSQSFNLNDNKQRAHLANLRQMNFSSKLPSTKMEQE